MSIWVNTVKTLSLTLAVVCLLGCSEDKGLKIKSLFPHNGPPGGGGRVVIFGSGFTGQGPEIYFGSNKARFLRFDGDTKMVVVPPRGVEGTTVDVRIIFADSRSNSFPKAYTYEDTKAGFNIDALAPGKKH